MGQTEVGKTWNLFCPHIFGVIPAVVTGVVTSVYEIQPDAEGKFISIHGLIDDKS